jgi:hypothetical protein
MNQFFDLLDRKDLTPQNVDIKLWSWSPTEVIEFVELCARHLPSADEPATSIFDFVSSSQLSGGLLPCSELGCRLERVESLGRFAALYAERIVVQNPFEAYLDSQHLSEMALEDLANDLHVMFYLRPLIESGIITFALNVTHFCKECYRKHTHEPEQFDEKVNQVQKALELQFLKDARFALNKRQGYYTLEISAPRHLTHSAAITFEHLPQRLRPYARFRMPYKFSARQVVQSDLLSYMVAPIIDDILVQNWYARLYHSNYITDRDVDFEILSMLNDDSTNERHQVLSETLTHYVPVLGDVELTKLLKLRAEEASSFQVYRDAVRSALKLAGKGNTKEMREAFDDLIRPELNNIELTIKNSKRLLWNTLKKEVLFFSGIISIGLYGGLLPPDVSQVAAALGGSAAALELLRKTSGVVQEPSEIRNNKYYFLWKVQKTLTKGGRNNRRTKQV